LSVTDFSLNGPWLFKGFPKSNGEELGAYKPDYSDEGWLPANVPGTVHTDLMANNRIPDPFKDSNEKAVSWVPEHEWWYRTEIELPPQLVEKQVIDLVFGGLDTFATVWVNGVKVGQANNMFTGWRFNIKGVVSSGKNSVVVRFKPIYRVAHELEQQHKSKYRCLSAENCSSRPYVRKASYSFGWDWAPTLPTCGIWQEAKIEAFDFAKIGYLSGLPLEVSSDKAKIKLDVQVFAAQPNRLNIKYTIAGFGQKIEKTIRANATQGANFFDCTIEILQPNLWWPRGYGEPNLYELAVEVSLEGGLLDTASAKVGIRKVELLEEPDEEGVSFVFRVNGLPVFCKGANWVPADSFLPRVSAEHYRKLLTSTAKMNANFIRVWGGGIYEPDVFYNVCDELGIMVWQDFMYVCAGYPEDDWFLQEAKREAEETVLRLRGHPCILLWCGNNENQWLHYILWKNRDKVECLFGLRIYEVVLAEVCKRLDSTRPYRPTTPSGGADFSGKHEGDRHNWEVWSKGQDYTDYLEDTGRFLSEFGWQAPASLEVLEDYLDKESLSLESKDFLSHEKQTDGLELMRRLLGLHYPVSDDLRRFVLYAQLNQADAIKTAVVHWRSRMFKTSGCLIWQLNDCWPSLSWSLLDYELNPKAAYFAVKRAFQPVIAPLIVKNGKAYVYTVNETPDAIEGTISFQVIDFAGVIHYSKMVEKSISSFTSELVIENALDDLPLKGTSVFLVTLESKGKVVYEETKTVKEPKDLKLPIPKIKITAKKIDNSTFSLQIASDVFAKAVLLKLDGLCGEFENNFFDLMPNRKKTIFCTLNDDLAVVDFCKALSFDAYPYNLN
jgi:beta-mannosidase